MIGWTEQACSKHELLRGTAESHREHIKHELGRQSSLNMLCIIRVPLTPLSRATSHKWCHELWVATQAAGAADPQHRVAEDNRVLKSEHKMCFLLLLTISGAFSGSDIHLVRTQVPRSHSNILHCWTIDVSKTSSIASKVKTMWLIVSLVPERSLLRKLSFLMRIRVATVGQCRPIRTASFE